MVVQVGTLMSAEQGCTKLTQSYIILYYIAGHVHEQATGIPYERPNKSGELVRFYPLSSVSLINALIMAFYALSRIPKWCNESLDLQATIIMQNTDPLSDDKVLTTDEKAEQRFDIMDISVSIPAMSPMLLGDLSWLFQVGKHNLTQSFCLRL